VTPTRTTDERWNAGDHRNLGVARAIDLSLPDEMPLWLRGKDFEPSDAARLRLALSA